MNLLDLIFPKYCLECKKEGKYICDACYCKVRPCSLAEKNNYSVFKYEGVIRKAIISLKYKFAYDVADELVGRMIDVLSTQDMFSTKRYTLVSIPLFWQRQNWRGFNQSEVIGEKIARAMNWKYVPDLLIRTKKTEPQVGLHGSARRSNLSGVFNVNSRYSSQFTVHGSLLLFDDVYTTGSTINEAKKVLKEAGFLDVKSLTIAR